MTEMNLVARINLPEHLPRVRAYVHGFGLDSAYNHSFDFAKSHLLEVLENSKAGKNFDFMLAILWGTDSSKKIDFFGYSGLSEEWKSNPGVESWVTKDGLTVPAKYGTNLQITCGDGLIILGEEE